MSSALGAAIRKCCMPTRNGTSSYPQFDNTNSRMGVKQESFESKLGSKHQTSGQDNFEGSSNIYVHEKNELKASLKEAIGEINTKQITIISLRDKLYTSTAQLIKLKTRESVYKNQLENGSREFKRLKLELEQAQGLADHHREQQLRAEEEFQVLLKTQKQHIQMLHEHLATEELMVAQKDYDRHEIVEIEHKIKNLQKELEIERRLKNEAKKDRDDTQAELDELLCENNGLRIYFRQSKHENERLKEEHHDEITECMSLVEKNFGEEFEIRVLEAQNIAKRMFDQEKYALVKEIENYRKKFKKLEVEKQKFAERMQQQQAELESARVESGSYKQQDIDKLQQETESLKTDLALMAAKLHILEMENHELVASVSLKDGELHKAQKWKGKAKQFTAFEGKCKDILDKDKNIKELENKLEQVEDSGSSELGNDAPVEGQEEVAIELHKEAGIGLQGKTDSNVVSTSVEDNSELSQRVEERTSLLDEPQASKCEEDILKCKASSLQSDLKEKDALLEEIQGQNCDIVKLQKEKAKLESIIEGLRDSQRETGRKTNEIQGQNCDIVKLQKEKAELESIIEGFRDSQRETGRKTNEIQGQNCDIVKQQKEKAELESIIKGLKDSQRETGRKTDDDELTNDLLKLNQQFEELKGYKEELKAKNIEQIREITELKDRLQWQDSGTQVEALARELQMVNKKMAKMVSKEGELRVLNEQHKIAVEELKENLLETEQDLKMKEELFRNEIHQLNRQHDWMKTRKEKLSAENSELENQLKEQQKIASEAKFEAESFLAKLKAAESELAASKANKKTLEKRCQKLKKQLADKEIECKNFETNYNELLKDLANAEKKYRQMDKESEMEAKTDECESAKRQFDKKVAEHEARLTEREAQLDKSEAKLEECELALAKSEEKRREIEKDLQYLRKLFNRWTTDFDEMKAENSGLKKELKKHKKYSKCGKNNEENCEQFLNENSNSQVALEKVVDENEKRILSESIEVEKKMDAESELQNEMKKQIKQLNSELDSLKQDFEKAEITIHLNGCKQDFQQAVIDIHLNSLKKDFQEREMEIHIKIRTQENEKEVVQIRGNNWEGLKAKAEQKDFEIRAKSVLGKLDNKDSKDARRPVMKELESRLFGMEKYDNECNQQKDLFETDPLKLQGNDKRKVQEGSDKKVEPGTRKSSFITECEELRTSDASQAKDEYSEDTTEKSNAHKVIERDQVESSSAIEKATASETGEKEDQQFEEVAVDSKIDSDEDFWGMEFDKGPAHINLSHDRSRSKDFEEIRPSENVIHVTEAVAEDHASKESGMTTTSEGCVGKESGGAMADEYYDGEDSEDATTGEYYGGEDFRHNTRAENYVVKKQRQTDAGDSGSKKTKEATKSILNTLRFKISQGSEKKKVRFKDKVDVHYLSTDDYFEYSSNEDGFYGIKKGTPLLGGFEDRWNVHLNGIEVVVTEDKIKEDVEIPGDFNPDEEGGKNAEKESRRVETHNVWLDEENDMLSNFISTQTKKQKCLSSKSNRVDMDDVDLADDIEDLMGEFDEEGAKAENDVDRKHSDSEYISCSPEENFTADSGAEGEDNITENITVSEINVAYCDYFETVEPMEDNSAGTTEEITGKQDEAPDPKQTTSTARATERNYVTVDKTLTEFENDDSLTDTKSQSSSISVSSLLTPAFEVARNGALPPLSPRKGALPPLNDMKMNM